MIKPGTLIWVTPSRDTAEYEREMLKRAGNLWVVTADPVKRESTDFNPVWAKSLATNEEHVWYYDEYKVHDDA